MADPIRRTIERVSDRLPGGVPGGGDQPEWQRPIEDVLPPGFEGKRQHRVWRSFVLNAGAGLTQTFDVEDQPEYWLVKLTSVTANQAARIYQGMAQYGDSVRITEQSGTVIIPGRDKALTVLNTGAATLDGTVAAMSGFPLANLG